MVEQLIRNEQVVGSSPTIGSGAVPALFRRTPMPNLAKSIFIFLLFVPLLAWSNPSADKEQFRVVLDPGHGGSNHGAPCAPQGPCFEKHLTLPIALYAESYLRSKGVDVYLTRRDDTDIKISDRVQFANQVGADALISIHLNASDKVGPSGFMTFTLSAPGMSDAEARLVKFESLAPTSLDQRASERYRSSDLEDILFDLTVNHGQVESVRLAHEIQKALRTASKFEDKGIRQAPFHILMGASMPAVVCELGFLNHPVEGEFLRSKAGQIGLAQALSDGVLAFRDLKKEKR